MRKISAKKTGRPKINNPKTFEAKARVDEVLNNKIVDYCKTHNITKSELIIKGINMVLEKK